MLPTSTFNITACSEFKCRVAAGVAAGRDRYGDSLAWVGVIGDLANMYTELRHKDIEDAVEWETRRPGKRRRADRVAVHRRRRETHLGRCYGADWVEVMTRDIEEVSAFDNRNLFVYIRGTVVRQCHGCPMGSHLSPPKAVICCSPPEAVLINLMTALDLVYIACRFMDDVFLYVAYDLKSEASWRNADSVVQRARGMYPAPLLLECDDGPWPKKYLESDVHMVGGDFLIQQHVYNRDCVCTGQQRKRLIYHQDTDRQLVQQTLMGDFHRARFCSNYPAGLLCSALWRSLDFMLGGHPLKAAAAAAKAVAKNGSLDPEWACIWDMLKELAKLTARCQN